MTFNRFDQFEAYIEHTLPDTQRQALEHQLATDNGIRAEFDEYRAFRSSIESVALKQQLERLHTRLDRQGALDDRPPAPRQSAPFRLRPVWIIAALLVIVLAGYGLYRATLPALPTTAQATFASVYRPEPGIRGATDCGPELAPGIRAYRLGNYPAAIRQFDALPDQKPCVLYYRGIANLALGHASLAITQLEQTTARRPALPDLTFQKSQWYLALAYLKASQPDKARLHLRAISQQPENPFRAEARRALTELNNVR